MNFDHTFTVLFWLCAFTYYVLLTLYLRTNDNFERGSTADIVQFWFDTFAQECITHMVFTLQFLFSNPFPGIVWKLAFSGGYEEPRMMEIWETGKEGEQKYVLLVFRLKVLMNIAEKLPSCQVKYRLEDLSVVWAGSR